MSKSEAQVQTELRLAASGHGDHLWRNNVGAAVDASGRMIRYGLGNDSARLNEQIKSSDLIGITRVIVTPDMVGRVVGVFTAIEVKREDWGVSGVPTAREQAQAAFIQLVGRAGGRARFATCVADYEALRR